MDSESLHDTHKLLKDNEVLEFHNAVRFAVWLRSASNEKTPRISRPFSVQTSLQIVESSLKMIAEFVNGLSREWRKKETLLNRLFAAFNSTFASRELEANKVEPTKSVTLRSWLVLCDLFLQSPAKYLRYIQQEDQTAPSTVLGSSAWILNEIEQSTSCDFLDLIYGNGHTMVGPRRLGVPQNGLKHIVNPWIVVVDSGKITFDIAGWSRFR